jgi:hypothetical protein
MAKFTPGESGNPKGRPRGRKDRRAALRELIAPHVPAILDRVVQAALSGDMAAAKLLLERTVPALRPRGELVQIEISPDAALAEHGAAVVAATLAGNLTPAEAADVLAALASQARLIESTDLVRRVELLEDGR